MTARYLASFAESWRSQTAPRAFDCARRSRKWQVLSREGVPVVEVRSPAAAVRDPQVIARGETVRLEHPGAPNADVYGPGLLSFRMRQRVTIRFHRASTNTMSKSIAACSGIRSMSSETSSPRASFDAPSLEVWRVDLYLPLGV